MKYLYLSAERLDLEGGEDQGDGDIIHRSFLELWQFYITFVQHPGHILCVHSQNVYYLCRCSVHFYWIKHKIKTFCAYFIVIVFTYLCIFIHVHVSALYFNSCYTFKNIFTPSPVCFPVYSWMYLYFSDTEDVLNVGLNCLFIIGCLVADVLEHCKYLTDERMLLRTVDNKLNHSLILFS